MLRLFLKANNLLLDCFQLCFQVLSLWPQWIKRFCSLDLSHGAHCQNPRPNVTVRFEDSQTLLPSIGVIKTLLLWLVHFLVKSDGCALLHEDSTIKWKSWQNSSDPSHVLLLTLSYLQYSLEMKTKIHSLFVNAIGCTVWMSVAVKANTACNLVALSASSSHQHKLPCLTDVTAEAVWWHISRK